MRSFNFLFTVQNIYLVRSQSVAILYSKLIISNKKNIFPFRKSCIFENRLIKTYLKNGKVLNLPFIKNKDRL